MPNDNPDQEPEITARDRGILSQADREYLLGRKDLSPQSERDARYRIRNRIKDSIRDFGLLNGPLSDEDREQVFEKISPSDLVSVFEFSYKGAYDNTDDIDDAIDLFEVIAADGVRRALVQLDSDHVTEDVDIDIRVDRRTPELEELKEKFERGEESHAEFRYLLHHSDVKDEVDGTEITLRSFEHLHRKGLLEDANIVMGEDDENEIRPGDYDDTEEFISDLEEAFSEV